MAMRTWTKPFRKSNRISSCSLWLLQAGNPLFLGRYSGFVQSAEGHGLAFFQCNSPLCSHGMWVPQDQRGEWAE